MSTRVAERHPAGALGRIGIVAGLHLVVIYLVATGLGIVPPLLQPTMEGTIVPDVEVPDELPPDVPPPDFLPRQEVYVPTPEVPIDVPPTEDSFRPPITERPPDVFPPTQSAVVVGVRADARYPLTQPPYPMSAVRDNQEGAVEIEVYVLPSGRVGDARVVRSTGYPALDQSALEEARRRWRLQPATRDGVPYPEWHRLRVVFELRNR
jgi:periplasmic protein TonB